MDMDRIRCEAIIINKLFAARRLPDIYVLDGGNGAPRHMPTPSTIVYAMNVPPNIDGSKFAALQDDLAAYIAQFYEQNGIVLYDEVGQEVPPAVRVDRFWKKIEVQRPDPEQLLYSALEWPMQASTALLGVKYKGAGPVPVTWNLRSESTVNTLIAGTTGSGKTNLLFAILVSLAQSDSSNGLQFAILDPKRSSSLAVLRDLPHCVALAHEYDEMMAVLHNFYHEMEERERGNRSKETRMVLAIEEAASILNNRDKVLRENATFMIEDFGRRCREANMNLILSTQSPTKDVIGRVKDVLPQRLVGAVVGKVQAQTATDIAQSGAEALPGRGAFIHRVGKALTRFQAPLIDRPVGLVKAIRNREAAPVTVRDWTATAGAKTAPAKGDSKQARIQEDAAKIRDLWLTGGTTADMIRAVSGNPATHTGSNFWRGRVTAAVDWLEKHEQQKPEDVKIIRLKRTGSGGD